MRRKIFLLTLSLCLFVGSVAQAEPPDSTRGRSGEANALNRIERISVDERDEGTVITVTGTAEPTYSVFKLNAPLRLFVDISNSTLGSDVRRAPISVRNGRVDQVAVLDFSDDVQQVTRVIVGFDTATPYDVRTVGDDVVIVVEGDGSKAEPGASAEVDAMQRELQRRESELERARRALLQKERRLAEVEGRVSSLEGKLRQGKSQGAERTELVQTLEAERKKAHDLRTELTGREGRIRTLQGSVSELESRVSHIERERDEALARARELKKQLESQEARSARLSSQLEDHQQARQELTHEVERLKERHLSAQSRARSLERERDKATRRASDLQAQRDKAKARASDLQTERDDANARARELAAARDQARKKSETLARRAKSAREELAQVERQLESANQKLASTRSKSRDALNRATTLRNEIEGLRSRLGSQDLDAEKTRRRLATLEQELEHERERARAGHGDAKTLIARLEAEKKDKSRRLESMESQLGNVSSNLRDKEAALDQAIARIRELEAQRKQAQERASRIEAEHRGRLARIEKTEDDRRAALARSQQKEKDRLSALADARKAEERRLSAVETARKSEERRLSAVETARKTEERRLAAVESARKAEEQRLSRVRDSRQQMESAQKREGKKLAELKRELDRQNQARADAQARLERARAELKEERVELTSLRKQEEKRLADTRRQVEHLSGRKADLEKDRKRLESMRDQYANRVEAARQEIEQQRAEIEKQQAELKTLRKKEESRLAETRKKVAAEEQELARIRKQRESAGEAPSAKAGPAGDKDDSLNTVRAIRFQQKDGLSRVIVEMNRPGNFATVPRKGNTARLELTGVSLPTNLERSLDTRAFGGTVQIINSYQDDKGTVHIEAEVPGATTEMVRQDGGKLYWEFARTGGDAVAAPSAAPGAELPHPQGFTSQPPRYVPAARESIESRTPPWQRTPRGMARKRLTIDLRAADIQNVLRLLAKEGGVNVVSGGEVNGNVTMRLQNVPVSDAFVTILKSLDLGYEQDGEILRVAPASIFQEEAERRKEDAISDFKLDPLEVVLVPINYADAEEVSTLAKTVLSSRGSATVDPRTNTLVIKDVAQNIAAVQQLILSLDSQTPQILIEARIVETNDRFIRELGVQWGGDFLFSPANGNPTGLAFPSVVGVAGAANDGQAPLSGLAGNPNFAVNLPAPIGTGSGGGIGLTLGSVGGAANLSLRLTALEENGHVKIVSSPKVLTLDNRQATISQGTSIPISVVSAAGVQTVFVEARLELSVTPHVTQDGNIQLALNISKSEPDFENTGARGDPTIIRKEAQTELLLGDGDTTVIGGIYSQNTGTSRSSVPFFGDIPILGFFFRDFSESETRTELLMFVTPRIVNREASLSSRRLSPIDAPTVQQNPQGGN